MNVATLKRFASSQDQGTFGVLTVNGRSWFTAERPWLENKTFVSCIPNGWYSVQYGRYARGGYETLEVIVPGRTSILVHRGNKAEDVQGCIAIGKRLGALQLTWAVLDSRAAFEQFWNTVKNQGKPDVLRITFGEQDGN